MRPHDFFPTLCESQRQRYESVLAQHPEAVTIITSDEKSGRRFGDAAKRAGMAVKIGSGGRNKGETGYQIWASWAPCDLLEHRRYTIESLK